MACVLTGFHGDVHIDMGFEKSPVKSCNGGV